MQLEKNKACTNRYRWEKKLPKHRFDEVAKCLIAQGILTYGKVLDSLGEKVMELIKESKYIFTISNTLLTC